MMGDGFELGEFVLLLVIRRVFGGSDVEFVNCFFELVEIIGKECDLYRLVIDECLHVRILLIGCSELVLELMNLGFELRNGEVLVIEELKVKGPNFELE